MKKIIGPHSVNLIALFPNSYWGPLEPLYAKEQYCDQSQCHLVYGQIGSVSGYVFNQ